MGMVSIYFLIFTGGLMAFATYHHEGCDPYASNKIDKGEKIMSFYVVDKLGHIWGLPGLFVATLIGGTLRFKLNPYQLVTFLMRNSVLFRQ